VNEADARRELVDAGHRLLADGLVARTWGNLSVRLDDRSMLVTPSGISYPDLTEKMIVRVDLDTDQWTGSYKPSGERKLHAETYRRRPEVMAGVHTHQSAASICAAARVSVPTPFGEVPCAPYALPGTKKITEGTVDALGEGPAVLMANHGAFAVGGTLAEAFDRVSELERACASHVVATRPREGAHMPAEPDAPWDPACLQPVRLADGTDTWLSTAPFTLRFSTLRRPLPPVLDDLAQLTGRQVASVRSTPKKRPRADAVLVPGRGALVFGADHEAVAMVVEKAARAWIGGAGLGGAKALPTWEAVLMRVIYARSYSKQAAAAHPEA
jgi:L-ribulose-5-phosphate 4-epimerase